MELVSGRIKNDKAEDYIQKYYRRHFYEKKKKKDKIINITIVESIENVYHVMIFFGQDWEKSTSYGQKHFREANNHLCKVSTV